MLIGTGFFILAAVVWVLCAYYAWQVAPKFGRNRVTWTVLCVLFGPIALMLLYILPKGHKQAAGVGHRRAQGGPQGPAGRPVRSPEQEEAPLSLARRRGMSAAQVPVAQVGPTR